jgi:hypothetical protein
MVTCGIDWPQDHHDIAIVDAEGRLVAKRRIPESVAGFTELTAMLADAGDDPKDPIPVAIETPRGLLVAALPTPNWRNRSPCWPAAHHPGDPVCLTSAMCSRSVTELTSGSRIAVVRRLGSLLSPSLWTLQR